MVAKTLEVARILKENGVKLEKLKLTKKTNGKYQICNLGELRQEGIDIAKIIKDNNLDEDFKFGSKVITLQQTYNGTRNCKITDEEKKEAVDLGLIKKIRSQDIGKATYTATAQQCDEASKVIEQLQNEKTKNRK